MLPHAMPSVGEEMALDQVKSSKRVHTRACTCAWTVGALHESNAIVDTDRSRGRRLGGWIICKLVSGAGRKIIKIQELHFRR